MNVASIPPTLRMIGLAALLALALAGPAPGQGWHLAHDESRLPVPPGLRADIDFWKSIFAEHSRDETVIHDSQDLRIVYEVLNTSQAGSERERSRMVRRALDEYRRILESLAVKEPHGWTREERRVAELFVGVPGAPFSRAAYHVRGQRGLREQFFEGLLRSGKHLRVMMDIFEGYGLPPQIAVLPHVESSFNPGARSRAGAIGAWQFTRSTGHLYLRIGYDIDERLDIVTATHAAARLLRDNYRRLGSWPLAIIAYNHGTAGLERAVREMGTTDVEALIRGYRSRTFQFASSNFYPEFLAALEVAMAPETYFGIVPYESPERVTHMILPEYVSMKALSKALRVSPSELSILNPSLGRSFWQGNRTLPKGYALRIPEGSVPDPWLALAEVPGDKRWSQAPRPSIYHVQRGDTLTGISSRFGVSVRDLKAANNMRGDRIYAGQKLHLPEGIGN